MQVTVVIWTRETNVDKARILVFSEDREFVNALARSWGQWGDSRELMIFGTEAAGEQVSGAVVVTDDLARLAHLGPGLALAIAITADPATPALNSPETNAGTRTVWLQRAGGWADIAVALVRETVLRLESQAQAGEAKQRLREAERFAALGRFIVEARHELGNALTGVLGHTELLLLESDKDMNGDTRVQVETIHAMSLKIHETFHRLTSLDVELKLAERQSEREQAGPMR